MEKRKILGMGIVIISLAILFAGCSGKESETGSEQVVYRMTGWKNATLNPHEYQLSAESDVMDLIYSSLYEAIVDPKTKKLKFIPFDAAESPKRNDDGTEWTFKIKKGLKWADGEVLDANDYEYSYKMLLDPKLKNSRADYLFGRELSVINAKEYWSGEAAWETVGIKAVDDRTLQLSFKYPVPEIDIMSNFGYPGTYSPVHEKHYEGGMNAERNETNYATSFETTPSSGTYAMTQWIRDQYKEFEKRENSPLKDVYTPEKITMRVVESTPTRLQLFENNETDYAVLSGEGFEKYSEDPRLVFAEATGVRCLYINMESSDKPFLTDVNFRKAMFWAMDRDTIARDIYKTADPATYFIATGGIVDIKKGLRYRDTEAGLSVNIENYGYDTQKALEYFNKAYEKYGKKMEMELQYFEGNDSMKRMGEYIKESFEGLFGPDRFEVSLRSVPVKSVYQNMREGNYELAFGRWNAGRFNPWALLHIHTSDYKGKLDRMRNKEYDALLARCLTGDLLLDPEGRINALADLERIILAELPKVPIYEDKYPRLVHSRIDLIADGKYVPGAMFGIRQSHFNSLD